MELNKIKEYIKTHELDTPSRVREKVYARFVLYYHLIRIRKMQYTEVGKMFKRDHSSVIYGVSQYEDNISMKWFQDSTLAVRTFLGGGIDISDTTLREEVMKCETLIELHRVQKLIKDELL